jgi:hypothetical protein
MKETNGARATTDEHPGTPEVGPRFTRAVRAERARLEGKAAQLLRKREAAQAEVARIERAVEATGGLLGLLAPLADNGGESEPADENGSAADEPGSSASEPGEGAARDRAQR